MENIGKNPTDNTKAPSSEVFEYYRLHTQNPNLSTYFCGTFDLPAQNTPTKTTEKEECPAQGEQSIVISPTSSITSNRKLEWDNGADIGYSNCTKLQKSFSFPEVNIKASKTSSGSSNQLVFLNSSSDAESVKKSESSEKNDIFVKIGKPSAESTPLLTEVIKNEEVLVNATPQVKPQKPPRLSKRLLKENVEIGSGEHIIKEPQISSNEDFATAYGDKCSSGDTCTKEFISCETFKSKGQESQATKKSNEVEIGFEKVHFVCDLSEKDKKPIQGSSLDNLSNTTDETVKKCELDMTLPQRLKYFNRYRTKKIKNLKVADPVCVECISTTTFQDGVVQTSSEHASIGIQTTLNNKQGVIFLQHPKENSNSTDSDLIFSNCNSFEFLYGSAFNNKLSSSSNSTDHQPRIVLEEYITKKLHRADVKMDLANISSENSSGESKNFALSRVLSSNSKDIDNNLKLLSKLVKSKKYDAKTKEYYLNKIIKKIMSEEESSSVTPEKITPIVKHMDAEKDVDDLDKAKLLSNLPWKPVAASSKAFEFAESEHQENNEENDGKAFASSSTDPENYVLAKEVESKSWRDDKTLSEKKLEECKFESSHGDSQNDAIVTFAQQERDHQLNWINNEIEHLNKLRSVLEKKETKGEPQFKDITNIKKTTSVYMITTERNETDTPNTQNRDFHFKVDNANDVAEIDFHLYSDHKDYKLKEIVTKLNPKPAEMDKKQNACPKRTRKKKENLCLCSLLSTSTEMSKHEYRRRKEKPRSRDCSPCCREQMKKPHKKEVTCKGNCHRKKSPVRDICIPCEVFKSLKACPYKCPYSDTSRSTSPYQDNTNDTSESLNSHRLKYIRPKSPKTSYHVSLTPVKTKHDGRRTPERHRRYSDSWSSDEIRAVEREKRNRGKHTDMGSKSPSRNLERKRLFKGSSSESETRLEKPKLKEKEIDHKIMEKDWRKEDKNVEMDNRRKEKSKYSDGRRLDKEMEMDSRRLDNKTENRKKKEETERSKKLEADLDGATTEKRTHKKTVENLNDKKLETKNSDRISDKRFDTNVTNKGVELSADMRNSERRTEKNIESKNSEKEMNLKVSETYKPNLGRKRIVPSIYDSEYSKADNINDNISGTSSNTFYDASATSSQSGGLLEGLSGLSLPSDFGNAKIISNTVASSTTNPNNNVRRVILELPIDHKSKTILGKNKSNQMPSAKNSVIGEKFSSRTATSTASSSGLCSCCGKFLPLYESNYNMQPNMCQARFCMTCFPHSQNFNYTFYENPQHTCHCQEQPTTDNNPMIAHIRSTLEELQELEACETYCKCKLNHKKKENKKKPVSYMLSFKHSADEDEEDEEEEENKKEKEMEEVVVKIPARNVKEYLGKEKRKKKNVKKTKSLQEYLESNKPSFVLAAEERRKYLLELALMREKRCQKYKQLLALTSGIAIMNNANTDRNKKGIFTTKEMKRMTAKNYKKLPEVQQKLLENREKLMKKANRMLADIYNKKLQENVLRGQPSLSTSVSVINLM